MVSPWCPLGLHRIIMQRRDWWHWPLSSLTLVAGATVWIFTGRHPVAVVALLCGGAWWFSMLIRDIFTLWAWNWPFERTIPNQLQALDKRFNVFENIGLFVVVALAMLWLARVA